MGITEGLSVTIAQHNGGNPTFEKLWASDSESAKLDIYYREGIGDLERRLEKWIVETSRQFDLQADGDDYTLRLNVSQNWPTRLIGLLGNKLQDYLVHCVTAGWLNDFDGLTVKQDYLAMATTDLDDIVYIVGLKDFGFAEKERICETQKDDEAILDDAEARGTDTAKDMEAQSATFGDRHEKNDTDSSVGDSMNDPASRGSEDTDKDMEAQSATFGDRHEKNDTDSSVGDSMTTAGERQGDDSTVDIRRDYTDWSGTAPTWPCHPRPMRPECMKRHQCE